MIRTLIPRLVTIAVQHFPSRIPITAHLGSPSERTGISSTEPDQSACALTKSMPCLVRFRLLLSGSNSNSTTRWYRNYTVSANTHSIPQYPVGECSGSCRPASDRVAIVLHEYCGSSPARRRARSAAAASPPPTAAPPRTAPTDRAPGRPRSGARRSAARRAAPPRSSRTARSRRDCRSG